MARGANLSSVALRGRGEVLRGSPIKVSGTPAHPSTTQIQTTRVQQTKNTVSVGQATQSQLTQQNLTGIHQSNQDITLSQTLEKQKEVQIFPSLLQKYCTINTLSI